VTAAGATGFPLRRLREGREAGGHEGEAAAGEVSRGTEVLDARREARHVERVDQTAVIAPVHELNGSGAQPHCAPDRAGAAKGARRREDRIFMDASMSTANACAWVARTSWNIGGHLRYASGRLRVVTSQMPPLAS
jgi:hypothetical protein